MAVESVELNIEDLDNLTPEQTAKKEAEADALLAGIDAGKQVDAASDDIEPPEGGIDTPGFADDSKDLEITIIDEDADGADGDNDGTPADDETGDVQGDEDQGDDEGGEEEVDPEYDNIDDDLHGFDVEVAQKLQDKRNSDKADTVELQRKLDARTAEAVTAAATINQNVKDSLTERYNTAVTMEEVLNLGIVADTAKLAKAQEEGKTTEYAEVQAGLIEKQIKLSKVTEARDSYKYSIENHQDAPPPKMSNEQKIDAADIPQESKQWLRKNESWMATAQPEVYEFIEGYNKLYPKGKTDPKWYNKLNREITERFPHIKPEGLVADEPAPKPKPTGMKTKTTGTKKVTKKSKVASVSQGGAAVQNNNPNQIHLTADDVANMEVYGLDPKNPEELKAYALEVRKTRAQENN